MWQWEALSLNKADTDGFSIAGNWIKMLGHLLNGFVMTGSYNDLAIPYCNYLPFILHSTYNLSCQVFYLFGKDWFHRIWVLSILLSSRLLLNISYTWKEKAHSYYSLCKQRASQSRQGTSNIFWFDASLVQFSNQANVHSIYVRTSEWFFLCLTTVPTDPKQLRV